MEARSLSPKELANVVGVSESSVKRWVDAGRIPVSRTAGGHRRILLPDALRFIRHQGMRLIQPELLGLDDVAALATADPEPLSGGALAEAVESGEPQRVRGLVLQGYLSGMDPDALFDGPIAEAMERYGTLFERDAMGIPHEHRFTQLCIEAIHQLRMLQPDVDDTAPLAIGSAPAQDPYIIPSLMVATVLAEEGFRDMNLGPDLPVQALLRAAERYRPALVWISATSPLDDDRFRELAEAAEALHGDGAEVLVGGRGAMGRYAEWPASVRLLRRMADLALFARSLR